MIGKLSLRWFYTIVTPYPHESHYAIEWARLDEYRYRSYWFAEMHLATLASELAPSVPARSSLHRCPRRYCSEPAKTGSEPALHLEILIKIKYFILLIT